MCGIAGYFSVDATPEDATILREMGDLLAHRGPDGEGYWSEGPVGLVHRRLAIIDLSAAAAQPMTSKCERYVISFNGEIYNFRELRKELECVGHQFQTQSDTEVLLAAWAHWETESLSRFNGMFAFSIYDRKKNEMHLCRDRYGVKPLYFFKKRGTVVFGSEVKAILKHHLVESNLNIPGLVEYFTFQNFFSAQTLFDGIHMLPQGSYLKIDSEGRTYTHQWWSYNFVEPDLHLSREEAREELDRLFTQAVKRQLVADVPVSSYLSGGIDSGAITTIASKEIRNLRTFTIGFDLRSTSDGESHMDEREHARLVSDMLETDYYDSVVSHEDIINCLPKLAWHIEEPRVGQSYPNFYAAKLAAEHNKVVLSGTGGDELFGGYPWRYYFSLDNDNFDEYIDKYYVYWQRLLPNSQIKRIFRPVYDQVKHVWTKDIFRAVFGDRVSRINSPQEYINHSLSFEAKTFLHGLLTVEDKLSMAHGVETRLPFLDNDLVDFAMQVPVDFKLGNLQFNTDKDTKSPLRSAKGKLLLREALAKYLPAEVANREKQGFSAPDASWFRHELRDSVKAILLNKNARLSQYMDREGIREILNDHSSAAKNNRLLIWSLISVEYFLQTFM